MSFSRFSSLMVLGALVVHISSYASASALYVSPDGIDRYFDGSWNRCTSRYAPCGTIAHALSRASDGDEINLQTGVYVEDTIHIDGPITGLRIVGGYVDRFFSRETDPQLTIISGNQARQIVQINAIGNSVDISFENLGFVFGKAERGGAVWVRSSSGGSAAVSFDGAYFSDNLARYDGGAIYGVNSPGAGNRLSLSLTRCYLVDNEVWGTTGAILGGYGHGGALSLRTYSTGSPGAQLLLSENDFSLNRATKAGSNVYLRAENAGTSLNGIFKKNLIGSGLDSNVSLGAVHVEAASGDADLSFENNQIVYNKKRGVIFHAWGGGSITASHMNDTITGNTGSGIFVLSNGADIEVAILNSIVWGNGSFHPSDIHLVGAVVRAGYSDIGDVVTDSGTYLPATSNFNSDPLLDVVPGGGAFMLSPDSPAIDHGTCSMLICYNNPPLRPFCRKERVAPYDDFQGDARPFGSTCDVGADEYVPEPSAMLLSLASLCTLGLLAVRRRRRNRRI